MEWISAIGYAPFIPAPPTEKSVVYSLLVNTATMLNQLGQENPVLTLDEKIYAVAKEVQWSKPDELGHVVSRPCGFHRAKNFMGVIEKRIKESGIEEIWRESEFDGKAVTARVLDGKHYYRGERGHRITLEALERMRWEKFLQWLETKEQKKKNTTEKISNLRNEIAECFKQIPEETLEQKGLIIKKLDLLQQEMGDVMKQFQEYLEYGKSRSELFEFWDEYTNIVYILLDFLQAERNADWEAHLTASAAMIPYDRAFDRLQYFRWGLVYLIDMHSLSTHAMNVENSFSTDKQHCISRSNSIFFFNRVSTDHALEQSQIKDSKSSGE